MSDIYEAHAFFALAFTCEECRRDLDAPKDKEQFSDAWYRVLATTAKEQNWFVPPPTKKGEMDVMRTWCPDCTSKLKLKQKK